MPILTIQNKSALQTDDVYFIHGKTAHEVMGLHTIEGRNAETIWERIVGYIFTADGYPIMTADGYMIKCKDQ